MLRNKKVVCPDYCRNIQRPQQSVLRLYSHDFLGICVSNNFDSILLTSLSLDYPPHNTLSSFANFLLVLEKVLERGLSLTLLVQDLVKELAIVGLETKFRRTKLSWAWRFICLLSNIQLDHLTPNSAPVVQNLFFQFHTLLYIMIIHLQRTIRWLLFAHDTLLIYLKNSTFIKMLLRLNPFKLVNPGRLLRTNLYRIGDDSDSDFKKISKPAAAGQQIDEQNVLSVIDKWVNDNDMCLFMKGIPARPQCGFSGQVVKILNSYGINKYFSYNILENQLVREQLKVYSKWPTFPQLYVKGKLVGGCDIVKEMDADGSLEKLLKENKLI